MPPRLTYRLERADPSNRWVRKIIETIHTACFPSMEMVEFSGDWWLAMDNHGRAGGFACLWPSESDPKAGYLARAGIMPASRGQGLQRRMIRIRETEARRKGWTRMISDTWPANTHSLNNLFRCGYRAYLPRNRYAGNDWIYVEKELG